MKQRQLGTTGAAVNEIGFGAMHLSIDPPRRPVESVSIDLIRRAVDELGVTFIDTADAYCADDTETGHNERLIATALADGRRERVIVATKGGSTRPGGRWERDGRPEHLRRACDRSLRALGVERIDLYQLHAVDPRVPIEESVGTIADMQRAGKIRWVGISNVDVEEIERAMTECEIVSVQNQFSAIDQDGEIETIRFCETNGITYLPWNPVGGRGKAVNLAAASSALAEIAASHDTSPHVVALAWLLQLSPAIIPIPGTRNVEHLRENMTASDLTLTEEEMEYLQE